MENQWSFCILVTVVESLWIGASLMNNSQETDHPEKPPYHRMLQHRVLHCFCHLEVRTKLRKRFWIICVYIHVYTQNICWLCWILFLDLQKTLTTEYLWNTIKVIFIEINYSCSEMGLSTVCLLCERGQDRGREGQFDSHMAIYLGQRAS